MSESNRPQEEPASRATASLLLDPKDAEAGGHGVSRPIPPARRSVSPSRPTRSSLAHSSDSGIVKTVPPEKPPKNYLLPIEPIDDSSDNPPEWLLEKRAWAQKQAARRIASGPSQHSGLRELGWRVRLWRDMVRDGSGIARHGWIDEALLPTDADGASPEVISVDKAIESMPHGKRDYLRWLEFHLGRRICALAGGEIISEPLSEINQDLVEHYYREMQSGSRGASSSEESSS